MTSGILNPFTVLAASITTATDTLDRQAASTAANHELKFVIPGGVGSGGTLTLTFSGFTGMSGIAFGDVDLAEGSTGVCSSATFTEKTIAGTPSGTTWGAAGAATTVTFTAGNTGVGLFTAGMCARIRIGTNASGGTNKLTNGSVGTATVNIATAADSGIISVPIDDSDSVLVTATVNETVTFDLDVGLTAGENGAAYSVPLGILTSGSVTRSNTSTIKQIFADGTTNASGGMNVSVRNTNGTNGLVSTSKNTDMIPNAAQAMAAGTANYGICVDSASITGWARSTTYNTTCTVDGATNTVALLSSTTPTDILTSSAPISNGHAQVQVNAAISTTTPAHTDYADTLYFIATGSF